MAMAAVILLLLLGSSDDQRPNFSLRDDPDGHAHNNETGPLMALFQHHRRMQPQFPTIRKEDIKPGASTTRKKRATLTWPSGSIFVAEFFITIPISAPTGVTIPFKLEVPYKFKLPNLTTSNFLGRGHKDDRLDVYGIIEGLFAKFGVDGRACVLRAVCEKANTHLLGAGLLGEIISTILAASSGTSSREMEEYVRAERLGKWHGDCSSAFPTCPLSLFNWIP